MLDQRYRDRHRGHYTGTFIPEVDQHIKALGDIKRAKHIIKLHYDQFMSTGDFPRGVHAAIASSTGVTAANLCNVRYGNRSMGYYRIEKLAYALSSFQKGRGEQLLSDLFYTRIGKRVSPSGPLLRYSEAYTDALDMLSHRGHNSRKVIECINKTVDHNWRIARYDCPRVQKAILIYWAIKYLDSGVANQFLRRLLGRHTGNLPGYSLRSH